MKFLLMIKDIQVLMTAEQLEVITGVLAQCDYVEAKYLGNKMGTNGSNYIDLIMPYNTKDKLAINVLDENTYGAMQLVTKLHLEEQAKK